MSKMPTTGPVAGIDTTKIWDDVKVNRAKLEACVTPHDFISLNDRSLWSHYQCTKCQGKVSWEAATYYLEGLKHGRLQESNESTEGR